MSEAKDRPGGVLEPHLSYSGRKSINEFKPKLKVWFKGHLVKQFPKDKGLQNGTVHVRSGFGNTFPGDVCFGSVSCSTTIPPKSSLARLALDFSKRGNGYRYQLEDLFC